MPLPESRRPPADHCEIAAFVRSARAQFAALAPLGRRARSMSDNNDRAGLVTSRPSIASSGSHYPATLTSRRRHARSPLATKTVRFLLAPGDSSIPRAPHRLMAKFFRVIQEAFLKHFPPPLCCAHQPRNNNQRHSVRRSACPGPAQEICVSRRRPLCFAERETRVSETAFEDEKGQPPTFACVTERISRQRRCHYDDEFKINTAGCHVHGRRARATRAASDLAVRRPL